MNRMMKAYAIFLLVLAACIGCNARKAPHRAWTYTEDKVYPDGIVVSAVVKAEEWAADEPARTTREYSVTIDDHSESVGLFKGEVNRAVRVHGVIILAAYSEFSIRSLDGAWVHVAANTTAELHQHGISFAPSVQQFTNKWNWLEIVDIDPAGRAIILQERKDIAPFCIGFDETGRNLEFRSH